MNNHPGDHVMDSLDPLELCYLTRQLAIRKSEPDSIRGSFFPLFGTISVCGEAIENSYRRHVHRSDMRPIATPDHPIGSPVNQRLRKPDNVSKGTGLRW
jgi:hypothetical protein